MPDAIDIAFECPDAAELDDGTDDPTKPSKGRALSKLKALQKTVLTIQEVVKEVCEKKWAAVDKTAKNFEEEYGRPFRSRRDEKEVLDQIGKDDAAERANE